MNYSLKNGKIEFCSAQYSGSLPFSIIPAAVGKSGLADGDVGVIFLRSPYYTAAINRFGIFLDRGGTKDSFGYLFPVSLLDKANEEEYLSMKEWQQDMMYIGYRKLLDYCNDSNKLYQNGIVIGDLEDIKIGEDVFLFVYDKKIEKDETKIIPAIYDKGFYVVNDPFENMRLYSSSYMKKLILADQQHKDLTLKEITESFVNFGYVKDLFINLLPYIENSAFRYILLYQVIEYLIDLKKNETWFDSMNTFSAKHSNELIHKLMDVGKEETLINKVFTGVQRGDSIYQEFMNYAKQLYDGVKKEWNKDTDFPSFMYGVRNIFVHNLKEAILYSSINIELSERYEKIICSMIMNVKIDECIGKGVFVYDMNMKYKDNVREFSKLFHEL